MLHISGTIHHMIVIYGTHVQNDNIFRWSSHFFNILIFWVFRVVKGQKMVQNNKKLCCHAPYLRTHIAYDCHL